MDRDKLIEIIRHYSYGEFLDDDFIEACTYEAHEYPEFLADMILRYKDRALPDVD